jgi:hypothetical protein
MRRFNFVCRKGDAWEVRLGSEGPVHSFDAHAAAMRFAQDAARLAWVDDGTPTGVQELNGDGHWEIIGTFGSDRPDEFA